MQCWPLEKIKACFASFSVTIVRDGVDFTVIITEVFLICIMMYDQRFGLTRCGGYSFEAEDKSI